MIYFIRITQIRSRKNQLSTRIQCCRVNQIGCTCTQRKTTGNEQRKLIILLIDFFLSIVVMPMCSRHVQIPAPRGQKVLTNQLRFSSRTNIFSLSQQLFKLYKHRNITPSKTLLNPLLCHSFPHEGEILSLKNSLTSTKQGKKGSKVSLITGVNAIEYRTRFSTSSVKPPGFCFLPLFIRELK